MPKPQKVVPEDCRGFSMDIKPLELNEVEACLYGVALNFGLPTQTDDDDLRFVFERHEEFTAFPTAAVVFSRADVFSLLVACPGMPGFNPMMLLHGEESLELFDAVPTKGTCYSTAKILDVVDKKKGALAIIQIQLSNEDKKIFANVNMNLFIRGIGGFGGEPAIKMDAPVKVPTTTPDAVISEKTGPNQALIYRLCGDLNPLHVDPNLAAMGGFDTPILHGLCFYGLAAKAVYKQYCKGHPERIRKVSARFTSHVLPGETVVTNMWKQGNTIIVAQKTEERGKVNLVGSIELAPEAKM